VTVVLKPVQTKQIRINTHKRNNTKNTVQTIRNIVYTSTNITKTPTQFQNTPTYTHPHVTNKCKQPQYKIHTTKWNNHNTIKYPQYKVTLMYMALSHYFAKLSLLQKKKLGGGIYNIVGRRFLFPVSMYCVNSHRTATVSTWQTSLNV